MNKIISNSIYLIILAGIVGNGYFMASNGEPDKLGWWPIAIGFFIWAAVPFVGLAIVFKRTSFNIVGRMILFATTLVITCGGIYILIEAFIIHLDSQSGLIFIFLPFFQSVVVAIGIGLAFLIKTLKKNSMIE